MTHQLAIRATNWLDDLRRRRAGVDPEAGDFVTNLAWAVVGVVAVMAVGALLNTLGVDVVSSLRSKMGL